MNITIKAYHLRENMFSYFFRASKSRKSKLYITDKSLKTVVSSLLLFFCSGHEHIAVLQSQIGFTFFTMKPSSS